MNRRIKQRQRQSRSITAMKNRKNNLEVGQRVYVDFLSSNRVETDGTRISGFGVLDRVETDGFVCGRLDNGQPFGCQSVYVQLETKVIGVDLGEYQPEVKFKTGDFVVLVDEGTKDWLLQVIDYMYTPDMYRVKILATGQCGPLFKNGMRHATDEEIAAGHRFTKASLYQYLEQCCEIVQTWPKWKIERVRNALGINDLGDNVQPLDKCRKEFLKDVAGVVPCWCARELEHYEYDTKANCFRFEGHGKFSNYTIALNNMWCIYQHLQVKVEDLGKQLKQAYEDVDTFAEAHKRECEFKAQLAKDRAELQKRVEWLEERLKATDTLSKMRAGVIGSFKTQDFNARTKRKMLILKKAEQSLKVGLNG